MASLVPFCVFLIPPFVEQWTYIMGTSGVDYCTREYHGWHICQMCQHFCLTVIPSLILSFSLVSLWQNKFSFFIVWHQRVAEGRLPEYYFSSLPMTPCVTRVSSLFLVKFWITSAMSVLTFYDNTLATVTSCSDKASVRLHMPMHFFRTKSCLTLVCLV